MGSFGEQLRQAREARKITLAEISNVTKIGTRTLQALEEDRFDQLPGGIFNKGFVRAYARYVGLDEEKTLAAYMDAANDKPPETDMQQMATQVAAARGKREGGPNATTLVGIVAVVVALLLGALWFRGERKEARERRESEQRIAQQTTPENPVLAAPPTVAPDQPAAQNGTQDTAANTNPPAATAPDAKADAPASSTPATESSTKESPTKESAATEGPKAQGSAPVEVSISATSRAWISVRSDGKPVETLTLDPEKPEQRTRSYTAKEKLMLIAGNPAGLNVTYNGKSAGSLGPVGQRTTITFTPEGMEKQP